MSVKMSVKKCAKCKVEKPSTDFYWHQRSKDGVQPYCKICSKLYQQLPKGRESQQKASRKKREKFPEKEKSRSVLRHAIRDGKIKRSVFCESCGLPAETQAHHANYSKPLDVIWVCYQCHLKIHGRKDNERTHAI